MLFSSETAQHVEWLLAVLLAMVLDLLQELSDVTEVRNNRVNKGWISLAWWRDCPVLFYFKYIQVWFELVFDISLQLQKENSEGT